jgi:hypothetical protein
MRAVVVVSLTLVFAVPVALASASGSGIAGTVVYSGGPLQHRPRSNAVSNAEIAVKRDGHTVALIRHEPKGRFTVRLRPGSYRIVARLGGHTCGSSRVTVRANAFKAVQLDCSIP